MDESSTHTQLHQLPNIHLDCVVWTPPVVGKDSWEDSTGTRISVSLYTTVESEVMDTG